MRVYVGNLPLDATEEQLRVLFAGYGVVSSLSIVRDTATGTSRGYAFVEIASDTSANAAISALNGWELGGYFLNVRKGIASKTYRRSVPSVFSRRHQRDE